MVSRKLGVVALNAVAGCVDTVGFLALVGSVEAFPSFMSGNSTKVVTGIVSGDGRAAVLIGSVVAVFIAGTVIARLINDGSPQREAAAMSGVALALWVACAGATLASNDFATLLVLAFAMGMINRSMQGRSGYTVHTFVSGAVVTIGSDIADALSGRADWRQVLLPLSIWGAILFGALAGGMLTLRAGLLPGLIVPAAVVSILAILASSGALEPAGEPQDGHGDHVKAHG